MEKQILACQAMFGMEVGGQLRALVREAVDGPCPCEVGRVCPLLRVPAPRAALEVVVEDATAI